VKGPGSDILIGESRGFLGDGRMDTATGTSILQPIHARQQPELASERSITTTVTGYVTERPLYSQPIAVGQQPTMANARGRRSKEQAPPVAVPWSTKAPPIIRHPTTDS
jgi:hypothetical protein